MSHHFMSKSLCHVGVLLGRVEQRRVGTAVLSVNEVGTAGTESLVWSRLRLGDPWAYVGCSVGSNMDGDNSVVGGGRLSISLSGGITGV